MALPTGQAQGVLKNLKKKFDSVFAQYALDPNTAKAVVFPEIMCYNALQDKLEATALKTLYVQYGESYANFSIGRFQMKPSFAEAIERAIGAIDKVRFLATADNFSFEKPFETIITRQSHKEFHTDLFASRKTIRYSYADLAAGYYRYLTNEAP